MAVMSIGALTDKELTGMGVFFAFIAVALIAAGLNKKQMRSKLNIKRM